MENELYLEWNDHKLAWKVKIFVEINIEINIEIKKNFIK